MNSKHVELFRIPKLALKVLGFWPETVLTTPRIIHGMINLIILSWAVATEFGWGITHLSTPIPALDAISPSLTKSVVILKLSMMWVFQERFRSAISKTDKLLKSEIYQEKQQVLRDMLRLAGTLGLTVFVLGNTANTSYVLRPIINNVFIYFNGGNTTRDVPFVAWQPFEIDSIGKYSGIYLLNGYFGVIGAFGFCGVDGFFVQFCMYMSALFKVCQEDLKAAFDKESDGEITYSDIEATQRKLARLIPKHVEIMELSEEIVDLFTLIIMGHFVSAALVICITSIDCIMASGFNILVYAVHSSLVVFELFMYCIGGSKVEECSCDVALAAYFQEWYKYDVRTQKMIILIMIRAQKGTSVQVPFFTPSIPVFGTMLGTAMSYITLVKTFL